MQVTVRYLAAAGAALLALAVGSQTVEAQALDRILKEKKIRITAEVTSPPFGILDKDNKPTGSEVETARQLAKDLGVELELIQVTGPQRIPALLSDRARRPFGFPVRTARSVSSSAPARTSTSRAPPTSPARRSA